MNAAIPARAIALADHKVANLTVTPLANRHPYGGGGCGGSWGTVIGSLAMESAALLSDVVDVLRFYAPEYQTVNERAKRVRRGIAAVTARRRPDDETPERRSRRRRYEAVYNAPSARVFWSARVSKRALGADGAARVVVNNFDQAVVACTDAGARTGLLNLELARWTATARSF